MTAARPRRRTAPELVAAARIRAQGLAASIDSNASALVRRLGALQAQDYNQLVWALGSRLPGTTAAGIGDQLADRALLRAWSLRGTIHLLPSEDADWMRGLIAERLLARTTKKAWDYHAVTYAMADKAADVISQALAGGVAMRRDHLIRHLADSGIPDDRQQSYFLFTHLALHGLICIGPNEGNQQTLALLRDWAPTQRKLDRQEALAELAHRFFTSHGPATVHDFGNWAGLPIADAADGLDANRERLRSTRLGDSHLWGPPSGRTGRGGARLLAGYDELHIGLKDRSAHFGRHGEIAIATYNGMFHPTATIDGQIVGLWRRTLKSRRVDVTLQLLHGVDPTVFEPEIHRLEAFYGAPVALTLGPPPTRERPQSPWGRGRREAG